MAITEAFLTKGSGNPVGSSIDTASITPTANRLVLAAVFVGSGGPVISMSGNGLTWVSVGQDSMVGGKLAIFRALGSSPSSGVATITQSFGGATTWWIIQEFAGVTSNGFSGAGAVRQSKFASGSDAAPAVTLDSFRGGDNGTFSAVITTTTPRAVTAGSGFTEIDEVIDAFISLQTQWKATPDTSVDVSLPGGSADWGIRGIELGNVQHSTQILTGVGL